MDEIERKALALACECAGRKLHHYALMGDDLPLRWSIEAHADTIMQYEALQAERDAQAAEIARLRETLRDIARDDVGLQNLIDDGVYEETETSRYYAQGISWRRKRARAALAQETQS